ncbi:MAG: T9SS type A sorting domain-containing protein [Candidatus Eisenbacteria bacterium]|nr:T9SS type A sorting domain-containing protein [Candidatus Eisenbacteria bacterium]
MDLTTRWVRGMDLRSLTTTLGLRVPPDSCTMDLTIRRAQQFHTLAGETVEFTVRDIAGGMRLAQQGSAIADASGLLTLPAIALSRHPARGVVQMGITWPGAGAARAALFDVSGRQVRLLWSGVARAATETLSLDTATLPPGLYLIGAEAGGRRVSKRMVVLR